MIKTDTSYEDDEYRMIPNSLKNCSNLNYHSIAVDLVLNHHNKLTLTSIISLDNKYILTLFSYVWESGKAEWLFLHTKGYRGNAARVDGFSDPITHSGSFKRLSLGKALLDQV